MSIEANVAVGSTDLQVLLVVPILLVLALLAFLVIRKSRSLEARANAWSGATAELGIDLVPHGSKLGPAARGHVHDHAVAITREVSPRRKRRGRKRTLTRYRVAYEAAGAPDFTLSRRVNDKIPLVDTGNPKFDAVVSVRTDQPQALGRFLTGPRRAAILRLLTYWPSSVITHESATMSTGGIETDSDKLVDAICHLVATAETFERNGPLPAPQHPSAVIDPVPQAINPTPAARPLTSDDQMAPPVDESEQANVGLPAPAAHGAEVLTDVRLDEVSVLRDLFDSGLDTEGIAARFRARYEGQEVLWTGEVLRVGPTDTGEQRIAAFVGSADGADPESGRVVALSTMPATPALGQGDVVRFSGTLMDLSVPQRLFHIV